MTASISLNSDCGCLPPHTNAAVGNNFAFELVNLYVRIFDKTMGTILLDEPLATLFGAVSGSRLVAQSPASPRSEMWNR